MVKMSKSLGNSITLADLCKPRHFLRVKKDNTIIEMHDIPSSKLEYIKEKLKCLEIKGISKWEVSYLWFIENFCNN